MRIPLGSGFDSHVVGFMEQVDMVNVGVLAILDRAIEERTSMVVEGVHMVPGHAGVRGSQGADVGGRCCCRWWWP